MSRDHARVAIDEQRVRESELADARRNLGNLRVGMRAGIFAVRLAFIDRPEIDVLRKRASWGRVCH